MKVYLNINRLQHKNELWEIFTVFPNNRLIYDSHRAINFAIWKERNKHSIAEILPLKTITTTHEHTIYTFDFVNINVPLNEQIIIQYFPVLGEKKCRTCCYERVINNKSFCLMKGIKNGKNSHYKCFYWTEDFNTLRANNALYYTRRSKEDGSVDERISGNIQLRRKHQSSHRTNNDHTFCSVL